MRIGSILMALGLLAGPGLGLASAQDGDESTARVTEERQMTLPASRALINVFVEVNLTEELVAKPFSIAPDLWYGVSDALTVGLVHSGRGATGFFGGVGNGLCLAGEENGCAKIYDSIGLDARYHFFREGNLTASADVGLFARTFDPLTTALKVGAIGRWQGGSLGVELAPSIFAGLTEREPEGGDGVAIGTNNKETLFLPLTAMFGLTPQFGLAGQVGATVPFEETGDTYLIGVSLGAQVQMSDQLMADLAFSFPTIAGGPEGTGTDFRTLTLGVGYAL